MISSYKRKCGSYWLGVAVMLLASVLSGCASSNSSYGGAATATGKDTRSKWEQKSDRNYQQPRLKSPKAGYESALQRDPKDPDSVFRLGTDAYRRGDFAGATTHFEQVLAHQPDHSRAAYNLAMVHLRSAYDGLQRYLQIQPKGKPAVAARKLVQSLDAFDAAQ